MAAFFLAPAAALQNLLPSGVYPLELVPGLGAVSFGFYNHRQNEYLSPYAELNISIPVYDSSLWEGFFAIWQSSMVVTSEAAQWVGVEGWGFPKVLGNVRCHSISPKGIRCMAEENDQLIAKVDIDTEGNCSLLQ